MVMIDDGGIVHIGNYRPTAIYYEDADFVEYVREDIPAVYRRVDEYLTLVLRMDTREIIGFSLKGFRHHYLTRMKNLDRRDNGEFLKLVSVLEEFVGSLGDKFFHESSRRTAYRKALEIAKDDAVELRDLPRKANA